LRAFLDSEILTEIVFRQTQEQEENPTRY